MHGRLIYSLLALAAVSVSAAPGPSPTKGSTSLPDRSGGFVSTCNNFSFSESSSGFYLSATCKTDDGAYVGTNIRLGQCLGNNNGNMVYQPNGGFGSSCNACSIFSNGNWQCECRTDSGGENGSTINLNTIIGNSNGQLVC